MRLRRPIVPLFTLLALAATGPVPHVHAADRVPGELIVGWRPGARAAERAALLEVRGALVLHRFRTIDAMLLQVDGDLDAAMAALAADPRVAFAEPNAIVRAAAVPSDPRFGEQWSLRNTGQAGGTPGADVDAAAAWDVFTGHPELRIGVIDSGIDLDHPDLVGNIWNNPGEIAGNGLDDDGNGYVDDVHGWDFANRDPDPDDDYGHGTHVAGILAARTDNGIGIAGLAWRARLVAIKFLDSSGSGTTAAAIEAIEYATGLGLRITNNSWGGPVFSQALEAAIAAAGAAGHVVVAAAGNRGEDNDSVAHYPSNYDLPNVVAVAATNANDALASFSNFGATSVDIAAPGVAILSCVPGGGYGLSSGTSMAAPLVSGTLALLLGRSPGLSPERAIDLLYGGAETIAALQGRVAGARRLNALRAVADPDTVAPGAVTALVALEPGSNSVVLEWIATGDDGGAGRASDYDIRHSTEGPIGPENVDAATRVPGPLPAAAGAQERFELSGLAAATMHWFAVRALDEFGNAGPLRGSASATTLGPPRLDVAPAALAAWLPVGARDTLTVSVANVAEGTLDFTLPPVALAFPPPPALAAAPAPDPSAKGEPGMPGPPVAASTGGPDAAGYRWIDSRDASGPSFEWIDVTSDGHRVPLTGDDALSPPLDLGFAFPFYGATHRAVRVSTNGALTFSDAVAGPVNQFLPSPGAPPLLVAPFWDDLLFASIERAWYRAEEGRFIVSWVAVPRYGTGGPYTFQAVLHADGEIHFHYLAMGPATLSATAGVQNADRTVGLTVAHNTAFFEDSLAVRIVPLPQWATARPASGRVRAGERLDLEVVLDARGLLGGVYEATLKVLSNDPLEPERTVPIVLEAAGAPDLTTVPVTLAFGDVFTGAEAALPLEIRNTGSEWLHLGRIEADAPHIAADASLFSIPPRGARTVQVTWAPTATGPLAGALRLHSNVGGGSVTQVPLSGHALPPPVLAVSPAAVSVELDPHAEIVDTVWIRNEGASPLAFTARAEAGGAPDAAAAADPEALRPAAKRAPDHAAGIAAGTAGGSDGFGYTWRTSEGADGPAFGWIDATAGGAALAISGDDVTSAPVPIGFGFPFYGATFDHVRVCTNGWLSFTSGLGAFSNTVLPSAAAGVPENLIAPWWDDLHFGESRLAWIRREAERTVIEWHEVGRLDDASRPNTFQAVLHADGRIRFQYLRMKGENLASATAGMQNGLRDDGLTIAFNTVFAHESLAIEIVPPARWFEIHPAAGEVAPGSALGLEVRVRPQGRLGGLYTGRIALTSSDPLRAAFAVPCSLTVRGAPAMEPPPGGIVLDPAYAGFTRTLEVDLANTGTAAFDLASVRSAHPALTATLAPARVEPGASARLRVSLTAALEGDVTTSVTLESTAGVEVLIPVRARVTAAPRAATATTRIEAVLAHGLGAEALTRTREVVIANEGGSPLEWRAEALPGGLPGPSVPAAVAAPPRGKGAAAPAGAIGTGGPDAAGYHWTDSGNGGPAFDWIDAAGTGTIVALEGDDVVSAPVALPFPFPFYDASYDSVWISSNGFLSFGEARVDYAHLPLPASQAPRLMVAPCWADFDLRTLAGSGRVLTATIDGRFIVSFLEAPRFGGGAPATFQVVLDPTGGIDFQYLHAGARAGDVTAGIQNQRGDVGLTVVHGAPYLEDGLRVSIRRRPPWLAVAPREGIVAPGAHDTLRVTFAAEGHGDGVETGAVRLITGDPARPERILPATLRIGRIPLEMSLETQRGGSGTPRWVEAVVAGGIDAGRLAASRPSLAGIPALEPGLAHEDGRVRFRFPRLEVLGRGASEEEAVHVLELAGPVEGVAWVHAADTLRRAGPAGALGPGASLRGGEAFEVTWIPREGLAVDAHLSLDGGATWRRVAHRLEDGVLRARAPREGAAAAWLELEGFDAAGYAGSAFLGPFEIAAGEALPSRLALAVAGALPARAPIAFELALPADAEVRLDVFDVRGARVATLVRGTLEAGRHRLEWNGSDRAGRSLPQGVYFARALAGAAEARARIVLLR